MTTIPKITIISNSTVLKRVLFMSKGIIEEIG
jgi:hypothetical protein